MMRIAAGILMVLAAACSAANAAPTAPAAAPSADGNLRGKLLERVDAGSYSYLRIATPSGETWAAVPIADVAPGTPVTIESPIWMQDFEGKAIGRKFPRIAFGTLADDKHSVRPAGTAAAAPAMPASFVHPPGAATPPAGKVQVERLSGPSGQTVEQVHARRTALAGKTVGVRGKVVKVNSGVLGKNWVHLRDGSGAPGSDDLLVTTQDECSVGEVVVARGIVRTDQDFGAGYKYAVLVEGARLER
ncbi:MAG: nucleotide-binding protein [Deltaproteobacteria bacterium]|nr:MAG: nucleotide-binding protein [Deltaproteobacteria bacterium]